MKTELLIEELIPSESNILIETAENGSSKNLWLSGIFMQGGVKNRNGRTYPLNEITNAVNFANGKITETNGIFGELDHPQSLNINLDRISHVITELKMVGNNAHGRARILPTPMGNIAKTLIESGVRIGMSSRGAGNVNESIVSGFNFITVDIVATPSAPMALPTSIYESLESSKYGTQVLSLSEQIQQDTSAQKYFIKQIEKFLNEMNWAKR